MQKQVSKISKEQLTIFLRQRTKRIRKKVQERKKNLKKQQLQKNLSSKKPSYQQKQEKQVLQKNEFSQNTSLKQKLEQQKIKNRESAQKLRDNNEAQIKQLQDQNKDILLKICSACKQSFQQFKALLRDKPQFKIIEENFIQLQQLLGKDVHTLKIQQEEVQKLKNQINEKKCIETKELQEKRKKLKLLRQKVQKLKNKFSAKVGRENKKRNKQARKQQLNQVQKIVKKCPKCKDEFKDNKTQLNDKAQEPLEAPRTQMIAEQSQANQQIQNPIIQQEPEMEAFVGFFQKNQSAQQKVDVKVPILHKFDEKNEGNEQLPMRINAIEQDPEMEAFVGFFQKNQSAQQKVDVQVPILNNLVRAQNENSILFISQYLFLGSFLFMTIALVYQTTAQNRRLLTQILECTKYWNQQQYTLNSFLNYQSPGISVNQKNLTTVNQSNQTFYCQQTRKKIKKNQNSSSSYHKLLDNQEKMCCSVGYQYPQVCPFIRNKKKRLLALEYNFKNYTQTLCATKKNVDELSNEEQFYFYSLHQKIENWLNNKYQEIYKKVPELVFIKLGHENIKKLILRRQMDRLDLISRIPLQTIPTLQDQVQIGFKYIKQTIMGITDQETSTINIFSPNTNNQM